MPNKYYPNLFQPLTIKRTTFRNRIWSAPNMMCHMDANGFPTEYMIGYYAEKAKGGAAVVTVGDTPVDMEHAATNPRSFNLSYESLPYLSELAMAIHEHGAIASLELNHGGMVGVPEANGGNDPIGPVDFIRDWDGVHVHGMTEEDMDTVAEHFADKAELLKTAGFDMCLVHGAHGWLLDQFISPLYNTRTDEYGGSLENRAKFPLMVVDRIRQRCGLTRVSFSALAVTPPPACACARWKNTLIRACGRWIWAAAAAYWASARCFAAAITSPAAMWTPKPPISPAPTPRSTASGRKDSAFWPGISYRMNPYAGSWAAATIWCWPTSWRTSSFR